MDGWMDSYKCSAGAQQQEPKSSRANARMHQYHKRFYYMQHLQQSKLMHQPNGQGGQNTNSRKVVGTVWHGYLHKKCHLEVFFNGLDRGRPLLRLTLSFPWPEAHLVVFSAIDYTEKINEHLILVLDEICPFQTGLY